MGLWLSGGPIVGTAAAAGFDLTAYEASLAGLQARLARDPTNTHLLFQAADLCFDAGARDQRRAVDLAERYFRRILELEPGNALARVMLGSTLTMQARDAFWPPTKLRWVREGIRQMDAAVSAAPGDPRVRFERAVNNFHMPAFLERQKIVAEDLAWLWGQAQTNAQPVPLELRQDIALYYGLWLKKQHQLEPADSVWTQGMQWAPHSDSARQIRQALRGQPREGEPGSTKSRP